MNLNLKVSESQITIEDHIFFKCCSSWDICKCHSGKLTNYDKRNRKIDSVTVKRQLLYNKYQDYQAVKKKYPGISFGAFVSGNYF